MSLEGTKDVGDFSVLAHPYSVEPSYRFLTPVTKLASFDYNIHKKKEFQPARYIDLLTIQNL